MFTISENRLSSQLNNSYYISVQTFIIMKTNKMVEKASLQTTIDRSKTNKQIYIDYGDRINTKYLLNNSLNYQT